MDNLKAIGGDVIVQVNPYTQLDCLEGAGAWLCKDVSSAQSMLCYLTVTRFIPDC